MLGSSCYSRSTNYYHRSNID